MKANDQQNRNATERIQRLVAMGLAGRPWLPDLIAHEELW
jgi:hypothetical protein